MKAETKVKIRTTYERVKRGVKDWIVPIFVGSTVGAAWGGYRMGFHNHKQNQELNRRLNETIDVVKNNAECQLEDRQRMLELERQQNLLFERALKETEGKT